MTLPWIDRFAGHQALLPARAAFVETGRAEIGGLAGASRVLPPLLWTDRPLLVVVPRERDIDPVADDLRTLAAECQRPGLVLPFPAPGPLPFRGLARHAEASWRRATSLFAAAHQQLRALVASPAGLVRPVLTPALFATRILTLRHGEEMTPEILVEALAEAGYRREDPVTSPGQMSRRGGILDIFPPDAESPVRIEFLADMVDSLRRFDVETQRSSGALEELAVPPLSDLFLTRSLRTRLRERVQEHFAPGRELRELLERLDREADAEEAAELLPLVDEATVPAWRHLPNAVVVLLDPESLRAEWEALWRRAHQEAADVAKDLVLDPGRALVPEAVLWQRLDEAPLISIRELESADSVSRPCSRYGGDLPRLVETLRAADAETTLYLGSPGRADRLREYLSENGLTADSPLLPTIRVGALSTGFESPDLRLRVLADGDIFPEEVHLHARRRGGGLRGWLSDLRDLKVGDCVVHQDHGIGRFEGLETLEVGDTVAEFMVIGYQGGDRLKVPVDAFDRIQKYKAAEGARPQLDRLGSGRWDRVKKRVRRAMREMAAELLRLYAERKAKPGHAFAADSPWLSEFEDSFEYDETPDQAAAIADVAQDMAARAPMDRLICGDVGYGKTEVAMRAAMRAVIDAKQVALLAPTTVLAFQHWKTFRTRLAPFPIAVEMVSRLRPARDVRAVLAKLAEGQVDVIIGTHRLLSKDVVFKDLGLVVVDEEQRFGVAAKERLKRIRTTVDCLTLSATPIPRTLQMGLAGIRDMSVIETPPKDRLAIQTVIAKFSTDTIAAAIRQELTRGGQVYLVHNRVESIYSLANLVTRLCPEARVVVAHGQMPETQLEKAMLAFVEGRADVLVCTTIIENGLDIPRANTIIVNRADRYGLAQLYQLRGRVGRSDRRAQALLLVPPDTTLSELARKRLAAIRDFSELGSGFRVAALDLELRGAGNLLGGQQSGHVDAVGLDLYVKLLEQTILELKGEEWREGPRVALSLGVDLRVPATYVPDAEQRMSLYKRLSQISSPAEIDVLRNELRDRYGELPPDALRLLRVASCRCRAADVGLIQVDRAGTALRARFAPPAPRGTPGGTIAPDGSLRYPLRPEEDALDALERLLDGIRSAGRNRPPGGGL